MNLNDIPKLNTLFRFQYEPAQGGHVLLFPEGMVKLNDSASQILLTIDGETSVAQMISLLETKFSEAGDLRGDVEEFLVTAFEKKWIYYDA